MLIYCMLHLNFSNWLQIKEQSTVGTELVDASQVLTKYAKIKDSIELVRMYDQNLDPEHKLLYDISTIADLHSGKAFGMFINTENSNVIGKDVMDQIRKIYPNDPLIDKKVQKLSKKQILDHLPDEAKKTIDPKKIIPSSIIRISVDDHIKKYGDSPAAIIELASTIAHEATHVIEYRDKGKTFDGPGTMVQQAESSFKAWVKQNWKMLSQRFGFSGPYPFS